MTAGSRIPAAEYIAIVKPNITRTSPRKQSGVVLVLRPLTAGAEEEVYTFGSWSFLRERLRLFGFASAQELDTVDVRLSTGRQPYMFSTRRWELPLIEALDLNCRGHVDDGLHGVLLPR
jgi:hypothetical protein